MGNNWTTKILWAVYFALLGVLLPHTAWAFRQWEPFGENATVIVGRFTSSDLVSWVAAFAFEAAIAVLTHKLSKQIEKVSKIFSKRRKEDRNPLERFAKMYLSPISFGLVIATAVSALANMAHAIQYGNSTLEIFAKWGIPYNVYSFAFGGILPFVSLIFARVLSEVVEDEEAPNPEVEELKSSNAELRKYRKEAEARAQETEALLKKTEDRATFAEASLKELETRVKVIEPLLKETEEKLEKAEASLKESGDLVNGLLADDKSLRIRFVSERWPKLGNASIAVVADAAPSYVTEVLARKNGNGNESGEG